jgi:hypothetical protein
MLPEVRMARITDAIGLQLAHPCKEGYGPQIAES